MTGRRALVTGASSGIGAELVRRLAGRGDRVVAIARRRELLEELAAAHPGLVRAVPFDLSDGDAARARIAELDAEERFDLVIANAGSGRAEPLPETPWSLTRDTIRLNLEGALATLDAVLPGMVARGTGQLVGISSLAAPAAVPGAPVYGATKAALSHWLDAARPELATHGLAVTIIEPGFIRTPLTDGNRHDMPLLMEVGPAVTRMLAAIDARRARLRFPRRLAIGIAALRALPRPIRDALIRRFVVRQMPAAGRDRGREIE